MVRQRATESQAGLTPRQRRINVRGAFLVPDPQAVSGRNVLVIDDILTTGATARSVAQVLLRAGATNVWVATLARARQTRDRAFHLDRFDSEQAEERTMTGTGPEYRHKTQDPVSVYANPNQPSF